MYITSASVIEFMKLPNLSGENHKNDNNNDYKKWKLKKITYFQKYYQALYE